MTLRVRSHIPDADGTMLAITPASAGWKHVGFQVLRLDPRQLHTGGEADREACLVVLSGRVTIEAGGVRHDRLGDRCDVFSGMPTALYVPASMGYSIVAEELAEVAICTAPGTGHGEVTLIPPSAISEEVRGRSTNERRVRNILTDTGIAENLLVVEVITPGGHWSSYPPHKHDRDALPEESFLEETYYYRLSPPQGFAFQRVYTDDRSIDEAIAVEDGDVVMVPRGYHPVGAPHGYDLYYLNVMAGPTKRWVFKNDPAHEWIIQKRDQ